METRYHIYSMCINSLPIRQRESNSRPDGSLMLEPRRSHARRALQVDDPNGGQAQDKCKQVTQTRTVQAPAETECRFNHVAH